VTRGAVPIAVGVVLVVFGLWAARVDRFWSDAPHKVVENDDAPAAPSGNAPALPSPQPSASDAQELPDGVVEIVESADDAVALTAATPVWIDVPGLASLAIRPGRAEAAVGGYDGSVHLVRLADGAKARALVGKHAEHIHATWLAWSSDGARLLVGHGREEWELLSADGKQLGGPWSGHLCSAALTEEGITVVGNCADVRWDKPPLPLATRIVGRQFDSGEAVAIARGGDRVVMTKMGRIDLHEPKDVESRHQTKVTTCPVTLRRRGRMSINAGGTTVLACDETTVLLWRPDSATTQVVRRTTPREPHCAAISADGRRAAIACRAEVEVWDLGTMRRVLRYVVPSGNPVGVDLSDDGKHLVCLTSEESAFVVDVEAALSR
jgi:hypothetical protein